MEKEIKEILNKHLSTSDGWGNSPQDCEITGKEEAIKELNIFILREKLNLLRSFEGNPSEVYDELYHVINDLEKELKNHE